MLCCAPLAMPLALARLKAVRTRAPCGAHQVAANKPIVVRFANDELHRYSHKSALKMSLVLDDHKLHALSSAAELQAGVRVQHPQRGFGVVDNAEGKLPEGFEHLLGDEEHAEAGAAATGASEGGDKVADGTFAEPAPPTADPAGPRPSSSSVAEPEELLRMPSKSIAYAVRPTPSSPSRGV